ncbi:ion transport peptide-like [Trichonephila clavipes]|nr:ion transport peptide-like [Trichonephila clavipes]
MTICYAFKNVHAETCLTQKRSEQIPKQDHLGTFKMKFMTIVFPLAALLVTMSVHADRDVKRSFSDLGCMGVFDKAKFARLDRVCEECYQLFRESDVHTSCRSNCFKNDYFIKCVDALLLRKDQQTLDYMVNQLYGRRRLSASSVKRLANQRLHLGRNEVSDWLDARHSTFVRLGVNKHLWYGEVGGSPMKIMIENWVVNTENLRSSDPNTFFCVITMWLLQ